MIPRFKPWLGWAEFVALFRSDRAAVSRFEREFAHAFKAADAVAFPYGRSAQWAFFKAMGVEASEIIMPAYTCSVVAHAVSLSGNTPRFIDIDLHDYNMNLDAAEAAINKNTRAIIATHTFGYPQNLDRLEAMVKRGEARYGNKIWLMQDCCHAFGAEWNGRMVGTSGDVAVYALNISKTITSIFGGMLTFKDRALAREVRAWRDAHYSDAGYLKVLRRRVYLMAVFLAFSYRIYGFTWWLQKKTSVLNKLTKAYHRDNNIHFPPDYLEKMSNVEALVGLAQLKRYPHIVARRRKNARWYNDHLRNLQDLVLPPLVDGATYSHYVVRAKDRRAVVDNSAKCGIELGELIEYSLPLLPEYGHLNPVFAPNSHHASLTTVNYPIYCSGLYKCRASAKA